MQTVLFIGLVWPEPKSSAAGTRMVQLLELFSGAGYNVVFASAASKTAYSHPLYEQHITDVNIQLNDSSFDVFITELNPAIVLFDRFVIEEQYGWRVRQFAPQALTILDTEDLHFLRAARQEAQKKQQTVDLYNPTAKREIASLLRTDLSLIISREEMKLLQETFHIPEALLYYLPFLEQVPDATAQNAWPTFASRSNFIFIGNFLHEPNWHTVQVLKKEVWPPLKDKLPEAEMHIYGAYASEKVYQLHQPKDRFFIKDRAADARQTMANYRVLLAPIAFGAGAKGKIIDAMQTGTPNVCSSLAAESMHQDARWNGFIADELTDFVEKAVCLYRDHALWIAAQQTGLALLRENYQAADFIAPFLAKILHLQSRLAAHRRANFIGEILHSQQLSSTKYMALWIAEKNKK
ncbi:glycosyltransferase [Sphingobacterium oryzagri]|uniref:Glycosyltransferase n=1 Tax=Sphingobacterium oryzagri TaxID=3025669 RepID=A0ABY7WMR2_9SPHI|nr:glycosyltransferase [Sphingobacterium sp. KACC 22765]WDF68624.1 glycosyltransferase [Sphingobacterium sp. KACC 22765]